MKKILFFLILAFCIDFVYAQITIHTIGDSTMEQKSEDASSNPNGQRGWAQMLSLFVKDGAKINDRAKSGTSSKTFYEEKDASGNYRFWATVKPQINAGDYVIIQFGHNDEKDAGWQSAHDGTPYTGIGTNPWEQYTQYLCKYVNEVRELGAIPILLTPIVRNGWSGSTMSSTACHNIGTDSIGRPLDYPAAMRKVADSLKCPLIDHTLLTKAYCESIGQSQTSSLIYNVGDGTHLGIFGATTYARLAVKELIRQGILTDYLNANPDLLVSPVSLSFGKCYANASSITQVSLSGTDLTPESGTLTVTAPNGYSLSTSQTGIYSQSIQYPYTMATVNLTNFYVKFKPTTIDSYNDSIVITNGTQTKKIGVSGECIQLTGQSASVYWELSAAPGSPVTQGPVNAMSESYSNMILNNYAAPGSTTTWTGATTSWTGTAFANSTKTQRNNVVYNGTSTWPSGDADIVNDRYIQFGVTAIQGTTFDIDSIGLYGGGAGGSGMRFKVYISKDPLFSDATTTVMIGDRGTNPNASNTMYPVSYNKLVELTGDQSLYLRVFPWYNGSASGKSICLYGVLIKGNVSSNGSSSINQKEASVASISCTPSPTTGRTTLKYEMDNPSDVKITIRSIAGQTVQAISRPAQEAGIHTEAMDLSSLPSGIYLCSVNTNEITRTTRIIRK